jgi:hypothetical protein
MSLRRFKHSMSLLMDAFMAMFCGVDSYSKTKAFKDNKNIDLVMKRVSSRFVHCFFLNHL